jgi:hypothetical protein
MKVAEPPRAPRGKENDMNCDGFPEPGCENEATNRVLGYDLCDTCARAYAGISEPTQDDDALTPIAAIRDSILMLRIRQRQLATEPNPAGVMAHLDQRIEALETAQYQLGEYRKLKEALAVLRNAVV